MKYSSGQKKNDACPDLSLLFSILAIVGRNFIENIRLNKRSLLFKLVLLSAFTILHLVLKLVIFLDFLLYNKHEKCPSFRPVNEHNYTGKKYFRGVYSRVKIKKWS
jgi:hypothetical protein